MLNLFKIKTMKTIFTTVLLLCFSAFGFAQNSVNDISNTELFSQIDGTLIKTEYVEIGKLKTSVLEVIIHNDLINNKRITGVKFSYDNGVKTVNAQTRVVFIDKDEVDALIKSIQIIKEQILPSKENHYTEVLFKTRGGFEAGCFFSLKNNQWNGYMNFVKNSRESYILLELPDFDVLMELLRQAKQKL